MTQKVSGSHSYFHYIDGLRGLAISLVVLFHFFGLKGGFIGVDVFFVISGYLITGIIVKEIEQERFSFFAFYAKRVRRIFPSLFLLLFVLLCFSWNEMFNDDFRLIGKHVAAGSLFFSNIVLWLEAGYFDAAAESKVLLHLWSLALEEQFYLVWPVFLLIAHKIFGKIKPTIIILILLSFAANIYELKNDPAKDFYFLHARLWEMAAGGLLAILNFKDLKRPWIYEAIGLLLITFGALDISGNKHFPGWKALVPVVGTILILMTANKGRINRVVFENKVMMFLGRISFPMYLWHWSIFAFFNFYVVEDFSTLELLGMTVLTIVLSVFTHYFIELPLKDIRITNHNSKPIVAIGAAAVILFSAAGYFIQNGKLPAKLAHAKQIPQLENEKSTGCSAHGGPGKKFNPSSYEACEKILFPGRPRIFLLGDSHAGSLSFGLMEFASKNQLNLTKYTAIGCTPLSLNDKNPACTDINGYILKKIRSDKPDLVIINSNYVLRSLRENFNESVPYPEFVAQRAQELVTEGAKKVLVVGQNPIWHDTLIKVLNVKFVRAEKSIPERTYEGVDFKSLEFDERILERIKSKEVNFFSLKSALCTEKGCLTKVGPNIPKDLIVFDNSHLTNAGSRYVTELMAPTIFQLLNLSGP